MTVPKLPSTASVMWVREVMTLRGPPPATNRVAASTLGPIDPDANWPSAAYAAQLGEGDPAELALLRGAPVDRGVVDVGGDDEHVGLEGAGEQGGGEVLVDDGLDAAEPAVGLAHHGDAAAAGRDDDVAGLEQRAHRADVEHLERLGGGHDAAPALLAAVLPHLAVVDQRLRLLAGQVAADRLARVGEVRVVAVDERAGDEGGDGSDGTGIRQGAGRGR